MQVASFGVLFVAAVACAGRRSGTTHAYKVPSEPMVPALGPGSRLLLSG